MRERERVKGWGRKDVLRIIGQQLRAFGCDIRQYPRNLLREYGFLQVKVPEAVHGSSRYEFSRPGDTEPAPAGGPALTLSLWGFGVVLSSPAHGGVAVERYDPYLRFSDRPVVLTQQWAPSVFDSFRWPKTLEDRTNVVHLATLLVEEILKYEDWLQSHAKAEYRIQCCRTSSFGFKPGDEDFLQRWRATLCWWKKSVDLDNA